MPLVDKYNRTVEYVRLAVTDRCNLRCTYCMPERGMEFGPPASLLTFEELIRLTRVLSRLGVRKVRITGGEPFVRRKLPELLRGLGEIDGIDSLGITTNGVLTGPYVPQLRGLGVTSVNLSLDTLDAKRFQEIARRDEFAAVWRTFESLVAHGISTKINCVVMAGKNEVDILPLVEMTRSYPVSVRFIEEMPFNGKSAAGHCLPWDWKRIVEHIAKAHPGMRKIESTRSSTAATYAIPGNRGTVGVIAAWSRTFCGACDRIRVTPQGVIRNCLYDPGSGNLRDLMRSGADDSELARAISDAVERKAMTGWDAAALHAPVRETMNTIGG